MAPARKIAHMFPRRAAKRVGGAASVHPVSVCTHVTPPFEIGSRDHSAYPKIFVGKTSWICQQKRGNLQWNS
jgi:hypothetical protein